MLVKGSPPWTLGTVDTDVLSEARSGDLHIFAVYVVKSFDTVGRDRLDCALGKFGLHAWFRKVYIAFHSMVRLFCVYLPQDLVLNSASPRLMWSGSQETHQLCPSSSYLGSVRGPEDQRQAPRL